MDFNVIIDLIDNVGFPIFCCIYMMRTMNKTLENHTEKTNEMMSGMKESLTQLSDAFNHFTMLITSIGSPVGSEKHDE